MLLPFIFPAATANKFTFKIPMHKTQKQNQSDKKAAGAGGGHPEGSSLLHQGRRAPSLKITGQPSGQAGAMTSLSETPL